MSAVFLIEQATANLSDLGSDLRLLTTVVGLRSLDGQCIQLIDFLHKRQKIILSVMHLVGEKA